MMTTTNLKFTDKEWELLKRLREANGLDRSQVVMTDDIDDIMEALGTGNKTTGDTIDEGVV